MRNFPKNYATTTEKSQEFSAVVVFAELSRLKEKKTCAITVEEAQTVLCSKVHNIITKKHESHICGHQGISCHPYHSLVSLNLPPDGNRRARTLECGCPNCHMSLEKEDGVPLRGFDHDSRYSKVCATQSNSSLRIKDRDHAGRAPLVILGIYHWAQVG